MSRYAKKALDALHAQVSSDIAAALRAVETDESITADSLTDPVEVVKASVPNDNRSPLIQIYWDTMVTVDQRNGMYDVDCVVEWTWQGGSDLAANELFAQRYLDAIYRSILDDQTLGGLVPQAIVEDTQALTFGGDESATRQGHTTTVTVSVHSPN